MLLAKRAHVCYYGQPELTHRPIIHILRGESPEEIRKLVTHEQIEHWPKFSASEGMNLEFMSPSESLKDSQSYLPKECQCGRNVCVGMRLRRNA